MGAMAWAAAAMLSIITPQGRLVTKYHSSRNAAVKKRYAPFARKLAAKRRSKRRLRWMQSELAKGGVNRARIYKLECDCCGTLFVLDSKERRKRAQAHGFILTRKFNRGKVMQWTKEATKRASKSLAAAT